MTENGKQVVCINLGSTSSEVGVLSPDQVLRTKKIQHDEADLIKPVASQLVFRFESISEFLNSIGLDFSKLDAIVCRGGRLKPVPSGVYLVNDELLADSQDLRNGDHASRLSVFIGKRLASFKKADCPVFIVDPISVDEFSAVARISGIKGVERQSLGHALNSKFIFRKILSDLSLDERSSTIIVAHMGGGATISLHVNGLMVDLINDFEGAFTPERAGGLPTTTVLKLLECEKLQRVERWIEGEGGLYSFLGTKQFSIVEQMAYQGDVLAKTLIAAYLYQQKKSIGSMFAAADMKVDGLALTGGIAHSKAVVHALTDSFRTICEVLAYPGSFEVEAMVGGAVQVLEGRRKVKHYPSGVNL